MKVIQKGKPKEFSKPIDVQRWNKIRNEENKYPPLSMAKKLILQEEKNVAGNFSDLKEALHKRKGLSKANLEFDLEWFLTWRIKLVVYRTCLWCDGATIVELKTLKNNEYYLLSETWLGPESNVNKLYKCKIVGTLKVNKGFDNLLKYNFEIDYQNDKIFITK